jgi:hypothetical protein
MSEVLTLAKGLLASVLREAVHSAVKQILLFVKQRTAPTDSGDGSADIVVSDA